MMKFIAYKLYDEPFEIVPASRKRDWMDETNGFAYRCLPMTVANQMGWIIPCPFDFTVYWDGSNSMEALTVKCESSYVSSHFGFGILTFSIPFVFRTPPGWGLTVRGAPNYVIPGVFPLEGFVETDWNPTTFTMNWKITEKEKTIHVEKGTPICILQPYKADELEVFQTETVPIVDNTELHQAYLAWSISRNQFNAKSDRKAQEWQKDYFNNMQLPKLQLKPFSFPLHLPRKDDGIDWDQFERDAE